MSLPESISHLTILCPSWVGDVVMGSCVWEMARKKFPDAKMTAVIRPHLVPLLEGVDEFDSILALDMKSSVFTAANKLKSVNSDAVVLLPNSIRSAAIAMLAGIKSRGGYKRDWRSWLLTDGVEVIKQKKPMPTSEYYLHLANQLFCMDETLSLPTISCSDAQTSEASRILKDISNPLVLLVAGASKWQKRWSTKKFAEVADALHEIGATCCAVGSPDEHELIQEVVRAAKSPVRDLTRSGVTLGSLKATVQQADLMITNDTGPRHIAVACGTPVITLYGPTDFRWTKYECDNDIALLADPFLPENLVADSNPERCNIDNIPSSDVIATAIKIIS